MSETLDKFFPPTMTKPKQDPDVFAEQRCANRKCRKILKITDIKYTLTVKGKVDTYCQDCAKKILRPQENTEQSV
jgi:hypothetical protein